MIYVLALAFTLVDTPVRSNPEVDRKPTAPINSGSKILAGDPFLIRFMISRLHQKAERPKDSTKLLAEVSFGPPTVVPKPRQPKPEEDVLCSLEVSAMDPAQILQVLSAQTGANLILLSKADTKLTVRLSQVPLSEMIRHICAMCDLSYLQIGKTYVIATSDRLKVAYPKEWEASHPSPPPPAPEEVPEQVTETYNANYISGGEIVTALDKIFKGKDLLAVAGPSQHSPEVGYQDGAKATGTSTSILTKAESLGSKFVIMSGPRPIVDAALAMAKQLDQPRRQVSIAVTINDITNEALRDLGITWSFSNVTLQERDPRGVNFGSFDRSPISIVNTLNALEKGGKSKLLAAPNVSVLDGERAFVLIGNRINYPVLVGYSQNNAPIFSKEEERVGIYLQVSPSISDDGYVTLSLYPQVSTITGYLTVNGASYPQISTREAQTTLRVASGSTIVMGGLFSDEEIATVNKVPFLAEIPILGEIFKHRKTTKTKSQVIITVTPTILVEKER
ncbi:MAG: hypothetical protein HONBIEJF_00314 [Fimbriimonadaceae bacterium]|nr:hypothetical protein [Fimbriimonadaceae bacterium]